MTKQIEVSKVRKGMKVWIAGVLVLVTKREKWNKYDYKIHFKDAGNGLPVVQYSPNTKPHNQVEALLDGTLLLEVGS